MFPKKITDAMKDRIQEVGRKQQEARRLIRRAEQIRRELPTTAQLAHEAGVCRRRVQELLADARKRAESVVSRVAAPLVDEVMLRHELRLDLSQEALERKRFRRRRPNTAIITKAAREAIAAREWAEDASSSHPGDNHEI